MSIPTDNPAMYSLPARGLRFGMIVRRVDEIDVEAVEIKPGDYVHPWGTVAKIDYGPEDFPYEDVVDVITTDGRSNVVHDTQVYTVLRTPEGLADYATVLADPEPIGLGRMRVNFTDGTHVEAGEVDPFQVVAGTPAPLSTPANPDEIEIVPAHVLQRDVIVQFDDGSRSQITDVQTFPVYVYVWYANGSHQGMHVDTPMTVLAESLPGAYWLAKIKRLRARVAELAEDFTQRAEQLAEDPSIPEPAVRAAKSFATKRAAEAMTALLDGDAANS